MIDERLVQLINDGAEITIKLRKSNAFVQIKLRDKNETFKASGADFDKALDRACEAIHSDNTSIRKARREKERLRKELLEDGGYDEFH